MKNIILLIILLAGCVEADNNIANNCTFQNNTHAGVVLSTKDNITINNSLIQYNGVYGIYSHDSNFTLNNSEVCMNTGWDIWSNTNNFGSNNTLFLSHRFRDNNYWLGTYMCEGYNKDHFILWNLPGWWKHFYSLNLN